MSESAAQPANQDVNRDLGFGKVVSDQGRRLVNPDGSFNVRRKGLSPISSLSLYHSMLSMTWSRFLLVTAAGYTVLNLVFAAVYVSLDSAEHALTGPEPAGSLDHFLRAFFFSVQTASTIGYGNIVPLGLPANFVVTIESFVGLIGVALITGLVFARFSRPTANILFSKNAIIAPYRGMTAFEFRIVNGRSNQLIEISAQLTLSRFEGEGEGRARRFYRLDLERERVAFFPLSWTIVHPIGADSPLHGVTREELLDSDAEFLILLTGTDDTFNQVVHARSSYKAQEVVVGARFHRIYEPEGDMLTLDISRLDEVEPVDLLHG